MNERTYRKRIEASHSNMSGDEIMAQKNARAHSRNLDRKSKRVRAQDERLEQWRSLSLKDQLSQLDSIFGAGKGAGKQRARIAVALESK